MRRVRTVIRHRAQPNPVSWKWRLVLMLTGGSFEAVPFMPARPINSNEVLTVHLGQEGALNTAEVKSMVHEVKELVLMRDFYADPAPNTFIAVDIKDGTTFRYDGKETDLGQRVVGTFMEWRKRLAPEQNFQLPMDVMVIEGVQGKIYEIPLANILEAYWAPMGYRP